MKSRSTVGVKRQKLMSNKVCGLILNLLVVNLLAAQTTLEIPAGTVFQKLGNQPRFSPLGPQVDARAAAVEQKVVAWRRDFHEHPELSNREFRTAEKVAEHLRSLGLEVKTGVAKTGVVAVLRGAKPGGTVALRADMDALPLVERVDLPFKSIQKDQYLGQEVGVMHACGHDAHTAMLMGAAEVLAGLRGDIAGNIVFLFQPAEEGPPPGEEGGAPLMIKEGALNDPPVEAIFGIHINSLTPVGTIKYRPGGTMAAADRFTIKVHGKGAHGSTPWLGEDPIVAAAAIVEGIQHIVSRQTDLISEPAVITVGKISGGTRHNIIPDDVEMLGTIRTLDSKIREKLLVDFRRTVAHIAEANDCTADITLDPGLPITFNNPDLTEKMLPTLRRAAGEANVQLGKASTGSEDFSFFAQRVPGLFVFLGGMEKGADPSNTAGHHTVDFRIDESGMLLGVRTYCLLALDWLAARPVALPGK